MDVPEPYRTTMATALAQYPQDILDCICGHQSILSVIIPDPEEPSRDVHLAYYNITCRHCGRSTENEWYPERSLFEWEKKKNGIMGKICSWLRK